MIGIAIANSLGLNKISGINPAAQAFLTATGITGTTEVNAVNTLVNGLQADGLWSKMKAVYPFVTDNRNLLSYTDTFSNAYWNTGSGGLKTPNYATAPDGTMTACRVYNGGYFQSQGISKSVGTYVFSFYVKMTSGTSGTIRVFLDGGFSTTTITVTNTWTRVEVTKTFASIDTTTSGFFIDSDVLIWQPQLELGSTATTYQPIATTQQAYISSQFKYNLVNPVDSDAAFRLVFNGGWTHSSTGATPNGTNGYADTKCKITDANSGHLSFYSRTNSVFSSCSMGGVGGGGSQSALFLTYAANQTYLRINSTGTTLPISTTNSLGYFVANRISSLGTRNFVQSSIIAQTDASIGVQNTNNYIGALSGTGTANLYDNKQVAFSTIGDGLTDTETTNLYNRVNTFQVALSRNV